MVPVDAATVVVVVGDRLKRSEMVWPGEKEARRRFDDGGEGGAAVGESSPDIVDGARLKEEEEGVSGKVMDLELRRND